MKTIIALNITKTKDQIAAHILCMRKDMTFSHVRKQLNWAEFEKGRGSSSQPLKLILLDIEYIAEEIPIHVEISSFSDPDELLKAYDLDWDIFEGYDIIGSPEYLAYLGLESIESCLAKNGRTRDMLEYGSLNPSIIERGTTVYDVKKYMAQLPAQHSVILEDKAISNIGASELSEIHHQEIFRLNPKINISMIYYLRIEDNQIIHNWSVCAFEEHSERVSNLIKKSLGCSNPEYYKFGFDDSVSHANVRCLCANGTSKAISFDMLIAAFK